MSQGEGKSKKLQAAANDLQIFQQLACENEDIVSLVRDALPQVPDVWVRAGQGFAFYMRRENTIEALKNEDFMVLQSFQL